MTVKEGKWTISSGGSRESSVDNSKKSRALAKLLLSSHPFSIFLFKLIASDELGSWCLKG